nr:OmpA family protein [Vibrio pectenicida]
MIIQVADLSDDDRDGVINARDLCSDTPQGSAISNDGCASLIKEEEQLKLEIFFDNNSSEINDSYLAQIESMASFLETYQSTSIQIQGYASKLGSPEHNLRLSNNRANAVQDELLYYGIAPKRVTIVGFGESTLEDEGDDEVAHATNRRVTATVVGLSEKVVEEWSIFSIIEK